MELCVEKIKMTCATELDYSDAQRCEEMRSVDLIHSPHPTVPRGKTQVKTGLEAVDDLNILSALLLSA